METNSERLLKTAIRVANPGEGTLTVWVEPWAERYELASRESLDLSFVGPGAGLPEVAPEGNEITVFGWEGSVFMAFQNGRVAGRQPTISEIVSQELQLENQVVRTQPYLPVDEMESMQRFLDEVPDLSRHSQQMVIKVAAVLIFELSLCFAASYVARQVLGRIGDRVIQTRGCVLLVLNFSNLDPWNDGEGGMLSFLSTHSVSMLPFDLQPEGIQTPAPPATPPIGEWKSARARPKF